jgi:predicted SnoaL-like aldol condensation-catalyzing enzyme
MTHHDIDLEANVRRFYDEVFQHHNLDIFDELVHPDYHSHTQENESTRDAAKAWFGRILSEFPHVEGGPEDVVVQGNTVALRQEYILRATPDGEPTIVRTMDFYQADEAGLLKEHWDILDLVQGDLPD